MRSINDLLRKTRISALALVALLVVAGLARAEQRPSRALVLSVGVAEYQNTKMNVPLPDKNAQDILDFFQAQEGKMFKHVSGKSLINEEATKEAIEEALTDLADQVKPGDYVVLYLCGHGGANGREWYFCPHDAGAPLKTLISGKELEEKLAPLVKKGGKVLLLLDSCHSGALNLNLQTLSGTKGAGVAVFAGCLPSESCYIGNGENSFFTQALLEALSGKADYNQDGVVTLAEVQLYISQRVEELASKVAKKNQGQRPTTCHSLTIPDSLPLAQVDEN